MCFYLRLYLDKLDLETQKEKLLLQKDLLLKEMRHRIANSLQLIASILLLKAETVESKESRTSLEEAHERILSIATVQQQLDPIEHGEGIIVKDYLTALCNSLSRSMIGGRKPITLQVNSSSGTVSSDTAVSLGLLTTELVINSLKHGFPNGKSGSITVSYKASKTGWKLTIADTGVGKSTDQETKRKGLGTSIVGALANQLHAIIRTKNSSKGMEVSIIYNQA